MKKILLVALVIILIPVGFYLFKSANNTGPVACTMEARICPDGTAVGRTGPSCDFSPCPANSIVGGDKDEHGCIGSAGYSWCEPKTKCLRVWEETCYAGAEQEIQYRLAQKYGKSVEDVTIKVNKKTSEYIAGSVFFATKGLSTPGEGGVFLAAKAGNMWELVYDGNGSIPCDRIKEQYSFPKDMLVGFCDI